MATRVAGRTSLIVCSPRPTVCCAVLSPFADITSTGEWPTSAWRLCCPVHRSVFCVERRYAGGASLPRRILFRHRLCVREPF